nr:histidine kinase [Sphingomonas naasensis]
MRALFGIKPVEGFIRGVSLNATLYVWLFAIQALVFELIAASDRAARNARNAEEAREAARAARIEALRNELNPHMLFNTFNGLSSLVLSGRNAEAEALLERLSTYMRACLEGGDAALIPLTDEIALIEAYLAIEAVRLARTPDVRIECPHDLSEAAVPRLILQPLVENALKYAVHPSRGAASVTVRAARDAGRLRLTVEDTGAAGASVPSGTGRGLSIVRRRLDALFGAAASLTTARDGSGFSVEILLPLSGADPEPGAQAA